MFGIQLFVCANIKGCTGEFLYFLLKIHEVGIVREIKKAKVPSYWVLLNY